MRLRLISAVFCSLTVSVTCAAGAMAANPGGVAAVEPAPAAATKPATHLHLSPVTSRSSSVAYSGPVYERTAAGTVVPYQSSTASSASVTTAPSPTTGGIAPTTTTSTTTTTTSTIGPVGPATASGPLPRPELLVPGSIARYVNGIAAAPMAAPLVVQEIIWAGNELIGLPYIYGGGHASFISPGYDCSGTVSFALHGGNLLASPEDSSEFEVWGSHGVGRWVTIFSNPEHAYMTVAGLRLDTSPANDPSNLEGPRWRPLRPANTGFIVRHPLGL